MSNNNDKRDGFSLVLALVVMSMCLLLTLSMVSFLSIEIQLSGLSTDRARARRNAIFAAKLAVAELQMRVGRDQTATTPYPAQHEYEGWCASAVTGLPRGILAENLPQEIAKPVPLVSGNHLLNSPVKFPLGLTEMAPAFSWGRKEFRAVSVPWLGNSDTKTGSVQTSKTSMSEDRFAFWIQDESQKADTGTVEAPELFFFPGAQTNRQLTSSRHAVDALWEIKRPDMQLWREGLSLAADWGWVELAWRSGGKAQEKFPLHPRLYTPGSRGVLSDARNGGLRINWDQRLPEVLSEDKLPCPRNVWDEFFLRSLPPASAFAIAPSEGLPVTPASTKDFALRRFPILSGLRIRFGVFHAHNDAYNRVRFHVEAQLWNPMPYPLTCVEKDMIGLFDIEKAPRLFVENLNTKNVLSVDMGAFPVGKFTVSQTESDNTVNANLIFTDATHPGMAKQGLLAGEVYHFFMPNPETQPEGLARTISGTKWYIQSDPKKPNTPPASATEGNWLHATHKIEIRGEMPSGGVTLHIREAKGKFATSMFSKDYSQPVLTLKNIPFKNFKLEITGSEFDRADSTGYKVDEARFGFSLRLRHKDPARILAALEKLDPRNPILDFNEPETAAIYEVIPDVIQGKDTPLAFSSEESFWWDSLHNKHSSSGVSGATAFADIRTLDRPSFVTPLSTGVLRHLPREKTGAGSLNPRYPIGREKDAEWFDKAFFAGAWPQGKRTTAEGLPAHWTRNPWLDAILVPLQKTTYSSGFPVLIDPLLAEKEDVAGQCFTRGVFNVNTCLEETWRVVLSRVIPDWKRKTSKETGYETTKTLSNALLRLPYGVDQPRPLGSGLVDLDDSELPTTTVATWTQCETGQGFRALDIPRLDRLAQEIVKAVSEYQEREGHGFRSLHEFALSGVLGDAIEKSQINEAIMKGKTLAPMSPLRINPGDILESLLPAMSVRGDTFKIRVRGAVFSRTGVENIRADAELIVQRFPEFFDSAQPAITPLEELNDANRAFGRRMKVLYFRWLAPSEQ